VLGQLVTYIEATRSFIGITRAWSEPAPGPRPLVLPLAPRDLATRASYDLRAHGIEMKRARTLVAIARRAARMEECVDMSLDEARARLEAFPGIGPWTSAKIAASALGDADAVPIGDYHLPDTIVYAFTGEPRGDDARMLELLAPYAGHRGRVVRLLEHAGIHAPRFGPRRPLRNFRSR
jgi:3-methyladenine DNA glycosylase/8-oxoguanine DNA glycosylase